MKALAFSLVLAVMALPPAGKAVAQGAPACSSVVDIYAVHQFCHYTRAEFAALVASPPDGVTYHVLPMCVEMQDPGDACVNQVRCEEPDTWKYLVYRSSPGNPNVPWGTVCLGAEVEVPVITADRVAAAMRRLSWPAAELTIQPPGGQTLVNFETNFFTTTTAPTTQTVTLLGQRVEIEASPAGYTWHFGDGEQQSGTDPGAAYPDLTVTHVYREAEVTVHPSVDITYHGRYRVNGGAWHDIPETLTVDGTPLDLEVLTATPRLVG
jgi:hypothetical protein